MSTTSWLIGFGLILITSACSPGSTSDIETEDNRSTLSTTIVQDPIATNTKQVEPSEPPPVIPTSTATETPANPKTEPSATILPTSTEEPKSETHLCDNPFEGESVRFPTQYWNTNFCLHSVPYSEIFSGGPPPDGIPPIDNPKFESVESADTWIDDLEPVIFFQAGSDIRAYPLQIMTWHEIVNDTVDRQPVVITFCPLCNTGLVFRRPNIDGNLLDFGTSGNLRNSDLVMYDRQTESWWQQFSGEAIVGDLTGTKLEFLPSSIISWVDFKNQYPDGKVLSLDTGFTRRYGSNPYVGYDDINQSPFLFSGIADDRLRPMERVLGIILPDGGGVAYTFERLSEEKVINGTIDDTPIVAFWKPGTASALDTSTISEGKDVGSTGVFLSTFDEQTLTFVSNNDGTFLDEQTNSKWNMAGFAEAGPLQGSQLAALPHHDTFWFAWSAFVPPDTLSEE